MKWEDFSPLALVPLTLSSILPSGEVVPGCQSSHSSQWHINTYTECLKWPVLFSQGDVASTCHPCVGHQQCVHASPINVHFSLIPTGLWSQKQHWHVINQTVSEGFMQKLLCFHLRRLTSFVSKRTKTMHKQTSAFHSKHTTNNEYTMHSVFLDVETCKNFYEFK